MHAGNLPPSVTLLTRTSSGRPDRSLSVSTDSKSAKMSSTFPFVASTTYTRPETQPGLATVYKSFCFTDCLNWLFRPRSQNVAHKFCSHTKLCSLNYILKNKSFCFPITISLITFCLPVWQLLFRRFNQGKTQPTPFANSKVSTKGSLMYIIEYVAGSSTNKK